VHPEAVSPLRTRFGSHHSRWLDRTQRISTGAIDDGERVSRSNTTLLVVGAHKV
jgi:hypothetical protein